MEIKQTLAANEEDSMMKTWLDYCKETDTAQDSIPFEHTDWWNWLGFAVKNYQKPLFVSNTDWNSKD